MKKLKFMKGLFLAACLFSGTNLIAQNLGNLSSDWQLVEEKDGIQFFARYEGCKLSEQTPKPFDIAFLKIVNNTNTSVQVDYNFVVKFTEGCNGCESGAESFHSNTIPANSSIEDNPTSMLNGMSYSIRNQNFDGGWNFENVSVSNVKIQ